MGGSGATVEVVVDAGMDVVVVEVVVVAGDIEVLVGASAKDVSTESLVLQLTNTTNTASAHNFDAMSSTST
jgi:hypothetical protein